jgi:phage terminase large subunit-like protein
LFFPERDGPEEIESQRNILRAVGFSGQHQQRPIPATGGMFDVEKIEIIDYLPPTVTDDLIRARAWDFAYSEERGDYTASALAVIDRNASDLENVLYIIEVTEAQVRNPLTEVARCLQLDSRDVHYRVPRDPGGGSRTADEAISMCLGRSVGDWRPTIKKEVTWVPLANWVNAGRVRFLRGAWNQRLLDQMQVAPRGKHDDMIDACTEAYGYLSQYGSGEMSFSFL